MKKKPAAKIKNVQKITPFLWFDHQAEDAARFYISLFKDSKIVNVSRYGDAGPGPKGQAMVVEFKLAGQSFSALNGGPHFKFTEAVSLLVDCGTQKEIDWFWEKLSNGGSQSQCGWIKDKYGLSWQIVPSILGQLMSVPDPLKSGRVMKAMLQMGKLDIEVLKKAYRGK